VSGDDVWQVRFLRRALQLRRLQIVAKLEGRKMSDKMNLAMGVVAAIFMAVVTSTVATWALFIQGYSERMSIVITMFAFAAGSGVVDLLDRRFS
jgi:hypothetical protein